MKTIRRIQAADREPVHQLLISTNAFQAHELVVALELIDIALTKPAQEDYLPYVLEHRGELVAYACFGLNPMTTATYDLYWLATRRDQMRQGYGRAIVAFVEAEVERRGGRLLVIETSSKESYGGSRHFYTQVGCEWAGCVPDFYAPGDDRMIYFKRLGPRA